MCVCVCVCVCVCFTPCLYWERCEQYERLATDECFITSDCSHLFYQPVLLGVAVVPAGERLVREVRKSSMQRMEAKALKSVRSQVHLRRQRHTHKKRKNMKIM